MIPEVHAQTLKTPSAHPPYRLLLVDDKLEDLLHYTAILQHLGYQVRSCPSYSEAAGFFSREDFDLVIVNQGGNSFEGRKVLARAIEVNRKTPVLVLTHAPSMACYIEAMQLGAFDYVQKPLRPMEVAELVSHHLRPATTAQGFTNAAAPHGEWSFGHSRKLKEN